MNIYEEKRPVEAIGLADADETSFRLDQHNVKSIKLVQENGHMAALSAYRVEFIDGTMAAGILAPGDYVAFGTAVEVKP